MWILLFIWRTSHYYGFKHNPLMKKNLRIPKKTSQNRKTLSIFVIAIDTTTHLQRLEIKGSKWCNIVTIFVPHQILETIAEEV